MSTSIFLPIYKLYLGGLEMRNVLQYIPTNTIPVKKKMTA